MPDTAAQKAVDWTNRHAIDMARIEAAQVADVTALLASLESKLAGMVQDSGIGPGKAAKLEAIHKAAAVAIGKTYQGIAKQQELALTGVAKAEATAAGKLLNSQVGADVFGPVLTESQWSAVSKKALVFGHSSGAWWQSQDDALRFKFQGAMQEGYAMGESVDEMVRRIRGTKANGYKDAIMAASRREAEALVRSSVQTISNSARLAGFEAQQDINKGIQWVSTLDGRTTPICQALNGLEWRFPDYEAVGHDKTFPGPTAHWNCRSTQIAIMRSWAELSGKPIKALDGATLQARVQAKLKAGGMSDQQLAAATVRTKASMDGTVPVEMDFQDWLKGKPDDFVNDLLGPGRFAMWKAGKITTRDLTDQNNRPLTLAQLQAAIDGDTPPPETEGIEYLPPSEPIPKFTPAKPIPAPSPAKPETAPKQPFDPTMTAADAAAKLAKKVKTTAAPDVKAQNLDLYVPDPGDLVKVKDLSGSTKPILAQDPATGKQWVVKSPDQGGGGKEHLKNEAAADAVYRIMGAPVPGSQYIEASGNSYKVAEFLTGAKNLGDWERTASPAEVQAAHAKIQQHFVMDALLGNWDVAGQSNDNIMVMPDGTPVRVDNGGALDWRAMGTKKTAAEWNATVTELETLRDPSKAAGRTAQIFAGLTDGEIHLQIAKIVEKRTDLIEAIKASKGKAVADMVNKRITYLEKQLPNSMKAPTAAAKQASQAAAAQIPKTIAKQVAASKTTGVAIPVGSSHVEDLQAMVWQEKSGNQPVTRVHLTLTTEGSNAVKAALGNKLMGAGPDPGLGTDPANHFIDSTQAIFGAMGSTVNSHKTDKAFNQGTVALFKQTVLEAKQIEAQAALKKPTTAAGKIQLAAAKHYLKYEQPLLEAMAKGEAPPWVDKFTYNTSDFTDDAGAAAPKVDFTVTKSKNLRNFVVEFKNGEAIQTGATTYPVPVEQGVYQLEWPDGTVVKYIPRTDRTGTSPSRGGAIDGIAMEGLVEVFLPAAADSSSTAKALEKLREIGIDTTAADADYRELVWLKKTAGINKLISGPDWATVESKATMPERIEAAREVIRKRLKIEVPKRGETGYTADGYSDPKAFHKSYQKVLRADLLPERITAEQPDLRVIHGLYRNIGEDVERMLSSGGELTATQDRVRRGIFGGEGSSAIADTSSGGASFVFTRLRNKAVIDTQQVDFLVFKGTTLARADAISHPDDVYGATREIPNRKSTLAEFAKMAAEAYSGNETTFKHGLSLVDEIDYIQVTSQDKRDAVIAAYKKAGFTKLPDGRTIQDIVVLWKAP